MNMIKTILKTIIYLIIISLIIIGLILLDKYNSKLKGEELTKYIYHYNIENKKNTYKPVEIKDNYIYYLDEIDNIYTLYKRNITSKKTIKVGTLKDKNEYCIFYNDYILCSNKYYDYKLNLINSFDEEVINYKDRFLVLKDNKLYENNEEIKELKYNKYIDNIVTKDNTYLVFKEENKYIYYDILNDKYNELNEELDKKYNEGYYKVEDEEISIYNVINNEFKTYKNLVFDSNTEASYLNNNKYYFIVDNKLFIADLDNKMIDIINYEFNQSIKRITSDDKYIYLFTEDNCDIYIIDNKIDKISYTFDSYKNYMDNFISEKVKELEKKYNINIIYKEEVSIDNDTFKTTIEINNFSILNALNNLDKVLSKFNKEFFNEFKDNKYMGLIIYLSGKMKSNDKANTIINPSAYTVLEHDRFEMVLDIRQDSLDTTICHEMMHSIENRMGSIEGWNKLNPIDFKYLNNYREDIDDKYTIKDKEAYFVDNYSKISESEDIAIIFENICSNNDLSKYPNLYNKSIYLRDKLIERFPSLKDSDLFKILEKK